MRNIAIFISVLCLSSTVALGNGFGVASKYKAVFEKPPTHTPSNASVDAPLLGNGNVLVALGGGPQALRFYIGKNDLWALQAGWNHFRPQPLARLDLNVPLLSGGSYHVEQTLGDGTTIATFEKDGATLQVRTWVAATEPLLVVELSAQGKDFPVETALHLNARSGSEQHRESDGVVWVERRIEKNVKIPTAAACALRNLEGQDHSFVLKPGKPVTLVAAVSSRFDAEDYAKQAMTFARAATPQRVAQIRKAHEEWWRGYWNSSFVEIPDTFLEQRYYLSLYGMGSASRDLAFPPGIFGWVTTDRPKWNGDYHMNYNHVSPFYGLGVANRIEQLDPCIQPILDSEEACRELAKSVIGVDGILMATGMGPKGCMALKVVHGHKSNAAYSCVPIAERWYTTYDLTFANKAYPFVKGVAEFWENWLKFEDGRYVIYKDSVHEGSGENVNPITSLALVRMVMNLALDMSSELGVDAGKHEKWQHIRDHMSAYPTCRLGDLKKWWPRHLERTDANSNLPIFRYTEKGTEWWRSNTVGIQHIFPGGGIGLDSSAELLERSRNQIMVMNRWVDFNGMNSIYAAAARVSYKPETILRELKAMQQKIGRANGMIHGNPHGIEQFSIVPNAIQEMLMQSHEGVIRLFPAWPQDQNASFGTLRARGAFLVSSELKDGKVQQVEITSERGRDCTVVNPWPGQKVRLIRGDKSEILSGERFTFKTGINEQIELQVKE